MTGLAVSGASSNMVEIYSTHPGKRIVALRALPSKMIGGFIGGVARDTICSANCGVIKTGRAPGIGAMTQGALSSPMVGRLVSGVARHTIRCGNRGVVESCRAPGVRAMA